MSMRKDVYERMRHFVLEKIKQQLSGSVVAVAVSWTDIKTSLKTNTLQVVLPDRFMPLSLKKALPATTQSLKIIVVVFVKHKQKKQRLELSIRLD